MPRRSWAVTVDDSEWPVVPFEVRETDVAVATEQMRVRVQRQECRMPASTQVVVCLLKMQIWVWAGAWGWPVGSRSKLTNIYGFGERTGLLKLAERKTNWTTDAPITALAMKCIRQFRSLLACVQKSDMAFFLHHLWSQFDIGAEQPGVANGNAR